MIFVVQVSLFQMAPMEIFDAVSHSLRLQVGYFLGNCIGHLPAMQHSTKGVNLSQSDYTVIRSEKLSFSRTRRQTRIGRRLLYFQNV